MSDFFGVTEQTWNNWKTSHPDFFESIRDWKREADEKVERSLFERAKGYTHPEEVEVVMREAREGKGTTTITDLIRAPQLGTAYRRPSWIGRLRPRKTPTRKGYRKMNPTVKPAIPSPSSGPSTGWMTGRSFGRCGTRNRNWTRPWAATSRRVFCRVVLIQECVRSATTLRLWRTGLRFLSPPPGTPPRPRMPGIPRPLVPLVTAPATRQTSLQRTGRRRPAGVWTWPGVLTRNILPSRRPRTKVYPEAASPVKRDTPFEPLLSRSLENCLRVLRKKARDFLLAGETSHPNRQSHSLGFAGHSHRVRSDLFHRSWNHPLGHSFNQSARATFRAPGWVLGNFEKAPEPIGIDVRVVGNRAAAYSIQFSPARHPRKFRDLRFLLTDKRVKRGF